jgi:hypothetical protein
MAADLVINYAGHSIRLYTVDGERRATVCGAVESVVSGTSAKILSQVRDLTERCLCWKVARRG